MWCPRANAITSSWDEWQRLNARQDSKDYRGFFRNNWDQPRKLVGLVDVKIVSYSKFWTGLWQSHCPAGIPITRWTWSLQLYGYSAIQSHPPTISLVLTYFFLIQLWSMYASVLVFSCVFVCVFACAMSIGSCVSVKLPFVILHRLFSFWNQSETGRAFTKQKMDLHQASDLFFVFGGFFSPFQFTWGRKSFVITGIERV